MGNYLLKIVLALSQDRKSRFFFYHRDIKLLHLFQYCAKGSRVDIWFLSIPSFEDSRWNVWKKSQNFETLFVTFFFIAKKVISWDEVGSKSVSANNKSLILWLFMICYFHVAISHFSWLEMQRDLEPPTTQTLLKIPNSTWNKTRPQGKKCYKLSKYGWHEHAAWTKSLRMLNVMQGSRIDKVFQFQCFQCSNSNIL